MTAEPPTRAAYTATADSRRHRRLWAELTLLFVVLPVVMATTLGPTLFGAALIAITVFGIGLLAATPGFRWRSLTQGGLGGGWWPVAAFTVATAGIAAALVFILIPERFLYLPRAMPDLWLKILILYPLLSAIPQELFYRVLFFERYGHLFPNHGVAIALNALSFGLAHLFYANWPALLLATSGGLVFAWAYVVRRSFWLACLLHAIGGLIIFTSGMGSYFYHGAVGRL